MKTFITQAAQGDLLLRRIDKLPAGLVQAKAQNGEYILAFSETHHHHSVAERPNVRLYDSEDPFVSYLEVIEATDATECLLEHLRSYDTHETIRVPPGIFEVRRQREHTPEGWRRAQD